MKSNGNARSSLLLLRSLTPVHAGSGRESVGFVDLPVQRDEFGIPCIWASSLKGALRSAVWRISTGDACFKAVFGPEPGSPDVSKYPSSLAILDAKLLFIPVRSLKGIWTYITSPHLLNYLNKYAETLTNGKLTINLDNLKDLSVSNKDEIKVKDNIAVLNEEEIPIRSVDKGLVDNLLPFLPINVKSLLNKRGLVIVDDDTMARLVKKSMLVQYRVRLNEAKTVQTGPWSEEYLPEEAILVSGLVCWPLPKAASEHNKCAKEPCDWLQEKLKQLGYKFWLGGMETIGRGFLELYMLGGDKQ